MKPREAHKDAGSCPITRYAVRLDPVNRITFYSGIVRGLAPIQAVLQAQMRADDQTEFLLLSLFAGFICGFAPGWHAHVEPVDLSRLQGRPRLQDG
jgi:hypothetical protein